MKVVVRLVLGTGIQRQALMEQVPLQGHCARSDDVIKGPI